jgi:hypothetical protein
MCAGGVQFLSSLVEEKYKYKGFACFFEKA